MFPVLAVEVAVLCLMNCFGPMEQDVFIVPTVSAEGQFMFCHHQILLCNCFKNRWKVLNVFKCPVRTVVPNSSGESLASTSAER